MPMKNPPHPGRSIRTACLEPLGLSVTEGAAVLGVTRQTLNNVINGNGSDAQKLQAKSTLSRMTLIAADIRARSTGVG